MLFGERDVIHEPQKDSLDGIGCFPVSPGILVIDEILESLFTSIGLLQPLCNLLLVFPRNISQYCLGTVDRAHLPGCAEEGGLSRLLDASMPIGDDQLDPGESPFLEIFEESQPERLILTLRDSRAQDLPVGDTTQ
jgi:hypothetical protein